MESWIDDIQKQLRSRDQIQCTYFKSIIDSCNLQLILDNKLAKIALNDSAKLRKASIELIETKATCSTLQSELQAAGGSGSSGILSSKKYQELEKKYNEIKEERTDLYKQQSLNTQKLLNLNETLRTQEDLLKTKEEK